MKNSLFLYRLGKAYDSLKNEGIVVFSYKLKRFILSHIGGFDFTYDYYITNHEPKAEELKNQEKLSLEFSYKPFFSVVVPLFKPKPRYLTELLDSVYNQTYKNLEICLADAGGEDGVFPLEAVIEKYRLEHPGFKIVYSKLDKNYGISENTNKAMDLASGDVIVFCDHDDTISPSAMFLFAKAMNDDPAIEMLYSDQDFISENGKKRRDPLWKPEFSIDFLRCCNYITHLLAVKRDLLLRTGKFNPDMDGAQDYDFILRLSENTKGIKRVPGILYHWRMAKTSTAKNPQTKTYAYENGRRALDMHYERCGIPAHAEITEHLGKYHTVYEWNTEPLISVIIPNKDHISELSVCIDSIYELSEYRNFEIVIVENNSEEQETFDYYKKIEKERENLKVVYYEGGFNYSKINNFGMKYVSGEYVLLLNNDTKLFDGKLLGEMVGILQREDVGAVGAKLFFGDGSLQHVGVIMGYGGIAGHCFSKQHELAVGNLGRCVSTVNYSAVTAACLMTKKSLYDKVGGLSEEFVVAFNDVDYCLKLRELGYLIVFTPFAKAWHFESKSRGYDDTGANNVRFLKECDLLKNKWRTLLEEGDPYYHPYLTTEQPDFSVRREWEWKGE